MSKTTNLGLHLTSLDETKTTTFETWQQQINGVHEANEKSNAELIDEAYAELKKKLDLFDETIQSQSEDITSIKTKVNNQVSYQAGAGISISPDGIISVSFTEAEKGSF